jgi:HD superfamily phosphohydrolase YqeK
MNNEAYLLRSVILYEDEHARRIRHLLTVHSLADMLSSAADFSEEDRQEITAAAILHDIGIKPCKEKYGCAPQELQRIEATQLVHEFLQHSEYAPSFEAEILRLVQQHHCYQGPVDAKLRILMEADLLANSLEGEDVADAMQTVIRSAYGKEMLRMLQQKGNCR